MTAYRILYAVEPYWEHTPEHLTEHIAISELIRAVFSGDPPTHLGGGSGVKEEVWDVLAMCWNHDPLRRPVTQYVHRRFQGFVGASETSGFQEVVRAKSRRRWRI